MEILFLVGRIIFGGFFLMNGFGHLFNRRGELTGYAKSKDVPMPGFAVVVSGLLLLFGGLGIVLGAYAQSSIALLIVFLVPTSFMMHDFWDVEDEEQRMAEKVNFMKNMALLGALLMLLLFAIETVWPYSLWF